jgi:lysophospholipase L1-like esterase
MAQGGAIVPEYLFRDLFTTDRAAGAVNGTAAEPGVGTRTVVDTAGQLSIAGGALTIGAAAGDLDPTCKWDAQTRAQGLAFMIDETGAGFFGVSNNAALALANLAYGFKGRSIMIGGVEIATVLPTHDTQHIIVVDSVGARLYYKSGAAYRLQWVFQEGSDATLWPAVYGAVATYDNLKIAQLVGKYKSRYGLTTAYIPAPAAGNTFAHATSFIMTFTVDNIGSGGVTEIYFRIADVGQNYWKIQIAGATGAVRLLRYDAGVIAVNNSVGAAVNGSRIVILTKTGSYFDVFVDNVRTKLDAPTTYYTATAGSVDKIATGGSISNLALWSQVVTAPYPFDLALLTTRYFTVFGDSKSVSTTWPNLLINLLEMSTGHHWAAGDNFAVAGTTVASTKAIVDANLAAAVSTPENVCINLGSNDASSIPAEADFKSNYRYIIEAIHAKWGSAKIYLTKPVRLSGSPPSAPTASTLTIHGWIDTLVGEYAYVYAGVDETGMAGGDGYVTNYTDTTHMTGAGQLLYSHLLRSAMGL